MYVKKKKNLLNYTLEDKLQWKKRMQKKCLAGSNGILTSTSEKKEVTGTQNKKKM